MAANPALTNLTAAESALYHRVFTAADKDSIGVITGDVAFTFLPERTKLGGDVLGEIWQIADSDDKGFLTPAGFQTVLRLVGYAQAGRPVSAEIAKTPGPLPRFEGINGPAVITSQSAASPSIAPMRPQGSGEPPIRVPALTPDKATQYAALFESTTPKDELMSGGAAKTIFDKAQIPNDTLVQIWNLADTEERGMLSQTEFIIAMHLIACFRARTLRALPTTLPAGLYEAASRRGAALPRSNRTSGETRQFSASSMSSPLSRPAFPVPSTTAKDADWAIPPAERAQYDMQFAKLDETNRGFVTGEQAVGFFKNSRLSDDDLAQIWDLSDVNSSGQLNKEEFSVALHLIRRTKNFKVPLPTTLPANLVPPSMRSANFGAALTQSPMATGTQAQPFPEVTSPAPAPAVLAPAAPAKPSAMDDLFGLDDFSAPSVPALPPAAKQVAQSTGGSSAFTAASQPPFGAAAAAAAKPPSTTFKPFVPTSSFGQSLSSPQPTGSATGTPSRVKSVPFHEDLLSDDEATPTTTIGSDSVDIGNLSNQVNTLQTQQSGLGTQRQAAQQNLAQSNAQKRELETRLTQLRTTYEAEAREVKELERRLQTSKADTDKARQDLAMVQHSYENLSQQRAQLNAGLELDQAENQQLKAQMNNLNQEVAQLKAHSEKMQSDARQQKGLVAINRKQLTSLEAERDRIRNELNTALTDHEGAIRELEETRLATQGTQSQLQDLQVAHSNKSRELEETRTAATNQRGQLDALNAQHQTLSNTLNQTHVAHQSALAELEQLDAAHASKTQELEQLQSSYAQLHSTHQSKLQEIEQLKSSHQSKLRELDEVKRNHEAKTRELEESNRQAAASKSEIAATGAAIAAAAAIPVTAAVASAQRDVVSPAASTRSATNPFFKSPIASPPVNTAPQTSGFDDDFFNTAFDSAEPAQTQNEELPVTPQRQLNGRTTTHERLPSATAIPPPPPESTQITSENLPLNKSLEPRSPTSSVGVAPPVSAYGDSPFNTPERAAGNSAAPRGASGLANMTTASEDGEGEEEPSSLGDSMVMVNAPETAESADPIEKAENEIPGAFPEDGAESKENENDGLYDATPVISRTTTAPPPVSFGTTSATDKGKERAVEQPTTAGPSRNEFPEIQEFDGDESDSDDENGFTDSFEHNKPQHLAIPAAASTLAAPQGVSAVSSALPTPNAEVSPPPYQGGDGPEQFPQEYKGLLPSREPPTLSPETSLLSSNEPPAPSQSIERAGSGTSLSPSQLPMPPGASSVSPFAYTHAAVSPPVTTPLPPSVAPATQEEIRPPVPPKTARKDDFDDFEDSFAGLSEARSLDDEDEETTQPFNTNGFTDFNPTFDSPRGAHSRATTANGGDAFADFENRMAGNGKNAAAPAPVASQAQPQQQQSHDWDAIFANLDAPPQSNTYAPPSGPPPPSKPSLGRAISMGTEHDDPILKRLVGMGYSRQQSLEALEKFDYNIDQAVDYLAYQ